MRASKVERARKYNVESVGVAELVSQNFHACLGRGVRSQRVRRVRFLVQVSQLLRSFAVDFATAKEQYLCTRHHLAHGFEESLRTKQVDVERFVRLLVAQAHRRLACQMVDVRWGNFLNHFLHVPEIQQVAGQVLYTLNLLPWLRKFVTETVKFVICAAQVR